MIRNIIVYSCFIIVLLVSIYWVSVWPNYDKDESMLRIPFNTVSSMHYIESMGVKAESFFLTLAVISTFLLTRFHYSRNS